MEIFNKYQGENKYNEGVMIEEYKGTYSLVTATERDGLHYKKWGYYQAGKGDDRKPSEKAVPWKIKLGDNLEEAQKMLASLYHALKGTK